MTRFVEAVPENGDVRHAVRAATVVKGQSFTEFGRALCGVGGRDGWGFGGMRPRWENDEPVAFTATEPNPESKTTWDGKQMNVWCPKCIRLVAKAESAEVAS
ncbi:hypothetical protein [Microbacterium enclense]|uniref:hypothetical protein n=1 Tax=Microbacterium enclense TaxID=993073 RepID=UPI00344356DF